eukprot:4104502-Alexandrium_andersonii.AAC.1
MLLALEQRERDDEPGHEALKQFRGDVLALAALRDREWGSDPAPVAPRTIDRIWRAAMERAERWPKPVETAEHSLGQAEELEAEARAATATASPQQPLAPTPKHREAIPECLALALRFCEYAATVLGGDAQSAQRACERALCEGRPEAHGETA